MHLRSTSDSFSDMYPSSCDWITAPTALEKLSWKGVLPCHAENKHGAGSRPAHINLKEIRLTDGLRSNSRRCSIRWTVRPLGRSSKQVAEESRGVASQQQSADRRPESQVAEEVKSPEESKSSKPNNPARMVPGRSSTRHVQRNEEELPQQGAGVKSITYKEWHA